METDNPQNSGVQATIVAQALDWAFDMFAGKGLEMPYHVIIQADSAASDIRNNTMLVFGGMLVAAGRLRSWSNHFHRVGHTHGPLDQRFSVAGARIARSKVLQTPAAMLEVQTQRMSY